MLLLALRASAALAVPQSSLVTFGDIPAGETVAVRFDVQIANPVTAGTSQVQNQGSVTASNAASTLTDDPDTGVIGDPTKTPLVAAADLTLGKSDGGASVTPGGTVAYTLTYSNVGNTGSTGVVLTETVPANTTFNAGASSASWSCTPDDSAGSICTLPIGGLPGGGGGGSKTFAVTVTNPIPAGVHQISNTASIADDGSNGTDPTPGNDGASDTTPIVAAADLSLTDSDGGASVAPGGTVTYTLTYANGGNVGATGVVLSETVPANTTFNAGASTAGWSCSPGNGAGSTCTLAIGTVAAGAAAQTATFAVTVASPLAAGVTQISNAASIADDGSNGTDPTPGNDSASDTTPITGAPDLTLVVGDGGATGTPGADVTYTLTYANAGNRGASGVVLTETVPANGTFVAAGSTAGWICSPSNASGSTCTLAIGTVAGGSGGGSATFVVKVASPFPAGVAQIADSASIADDGGNGADPNLANNASSDPTPIAAAPDLSIHKTHAGGVPLPGTTITFTLAYGNAGNQDNTGVVLHETVPANTTFVAASSDAAWSCPAVTAGTACTLSVGALAGGGAGGLVVFTVKVDDPLPLGTSEIHNCASIDGNGADGNAANDASCDTVTLDDVPPQVTSIDTLPSTADGALGECETDTGEINRLLVDFDEAMANPAGDATSGDVTNPASYLLVQPGPDGQYESSGCSVGGDDVAVTIPSVSYDDARHTATLELGGRLASSPYELTVCPALTDVAGNALDGNADGDGGDAFVRRFRLDSGNLLANGQVDCSLAGWTLTGAVDRSDQDVAAAPISGSAHAQGGPRATVVVDGADKVPQQAYAIAQCVNVAASASYQLTSRARLDAASGIAVTFDQSCRFFEGKACTGAVLATDGASVLMSSTGGAWLSPQRTFAAPAAAQSALCAFTATSQLASSFDVFADAMSLRRLDVLFADGFESADVSAWSSPVGN